MNYQTKEKITNIRTAIENGATVEEIDKSYFKTKTIKITFLTRNKNYFDPEELKYLNFDSETNSLTMLEVPKNNKSNKKTKLETTEEKKEIKKDFFDFVDEEAKKEIDFVDEDEEINNLTMLETAKNDNSISLTEEQKFLKDENNLKILVEMIKRYKNQNENLVEVIENGIVNIPVEAKELALDGTLGVRTNKEVYEKIVELAFKNKVGKGEFVTFILWDFLRRNS
ncbi:MAG: hypothetical protein HXM96_07345 [Parvimonas sp.]|uniref:hypothetical protein n=1 Tax=Parvimonas sp. TaxID=1944660 RepID=UPI001CAE5FB6|nr:hypothetical protein [Parvimonas sp.]MBF1295864.1 hypothetical protein [Parvimonas sp.]